MLDSGWEPPFSWSPWKQEVPPSFQEQSLYSWTLTEADAEGEFWSSSSWPLARRPPAQLQ